MPAWPSPANSPPEVQRAGGTPSTRWPSGCRSRSTIISDDRDRSRDFVADVSHELRTPIAALRTFNELLLRGRRRGPRDARRVPASRAASRSSGSTGWPPTCSSCPSSTPGLVGAATCATEDLRAVVENAVEQASPWPSARASARARTCRPMPVSQPHDPPRLGPGAEQPHRQRHQVHAGGRPRRRRASSATARAPSFTVTDDGVGIDPTELEHVFDRFYRGTRRPRGASRRLGPGPGHRTLDRGHAPGPGGPSPARRTWAPRSSVTLPRAGVGFFTRRPPA